jgi:SAM-dependent methyltransferase
LDRHDPIWTTSCIQANLPVRDLKDPHDHLRLLHGAVTPSGGPWVDIGSGRGAFTLALGELIGSSGIIFSADKDRIALQEHRRTMMAHLPHLQVQDLQEDFTQLLRLPPQDGIVIANALHFVPPDMKPTVVKLLKRYLRPYGHLILIESTVDQRDREELFPLSCQVWASPA